MGSRDSYIAKRWWGAKLRLVQPVAVINRALGRFDEVVWLIGDGRSGSTWIANLIASTRHYRQLFEPFHPFKVPQFAQFPLNKFESRKARNDALKAKMAAIFDGRICHRRVDGPPARLIYDGLLVKDVFASLFAAWAMEQFPTSGPVLFIRNPFAIAAPKLQKGRWLWTAGSSELLRKVGREESPCAVTLSRLPES